MSADWPVLLTLFSIVVVVAYAVAYTKTDSGRLAVLDSRSKHARDVEIERIKLEMEKLKTYAGAGR